MTRTLILMRHAKSSWDNPGQNDHARPLNPRGRRSATALGDWLRAEGWLPDEVISSSSARTRGTFAGLKLDVPAQFTDALYHADPDRMLAVLAQARGETVLMLGHNPGIAAFAARLLTAPPDHPRFADYPTCATLVARFEIANWHALRWHSGRPLAFVIPRELSGA